jgi:hypothetical protein
MAKSNAKKTREKLVREGRRNPEESRSPFVFTDMRTRTTKTKKDYLYQRNKKNHSSQLGNDGSFLRFNHIFFNFNPKTYFSNTKLASPIPRSVLTIILTSASL